MQPKQTDSVVRLGQTLVDDVIRRGGSSLDGLPDPPHDDVPVVTLSVGHLSRMALLVATATIFVVGLIGTAAYLMSGSHKSQGNNAIGSNVQHLSVQGLSGYNQLARGLAQNLQVNGQLSIEGSLVLGPTTAPSRPTLGQLYFDSSTNQPYYFNGSQFISLQPVVGGTIAGATTSLNLSQGLALQGTNLANTGVTTLSGTPNQITVSASTGSITLSLPTNLSIAGSFSAGSLSGNGSGITNLQSSALPSDVAFTDHNDQLFTGRRQVFRPSANDTNAFSIQDASGNTLLSADTTQDTLTVTTLLPETPGSFTPGVSFTTLSNDADYAASQATGSDGFPRIAYMNSNYQLMYIRCEDVNCQTKVSTQVASSLTAYDYSTGNQIMTLGSDGFARILLIDSSDYSLKMVRCLDEDCSTYNIDSIDPNGGNEPGYYGAALVMGQDGFPRIAYADASGTDDNYYVRCTDADCTSPAINAVGYSGNYSYDEVALAIASDGFGRLVYEDANDYTLKMARCLDADCSTYNADTVDPNASNYPGYAGKAIVMGSDGFPRISYVNYDSNYTVNYAQCTDADCASPVLAKIDNGQFTEDGIGMGLNSSGNAVLSYSNSNYSLTLATCNSASCSSPTIVVLDSSAQYSTYDNDSLAIAADGSVGIVYGYDNLLMARAINPTGQDIISGTSIGTSTEPFGLINTDSLTVQNAGGGSLLTAQDNSVTVSNGNFNVQDSAGYTILNDDTNTHQLTVSGSPNVLLANLITNEDFGSSYWNHSGGWGGSGWTTLTTNTATYTTSPSNAGGALSTTSSVVPTGGTYYYAFAISNAACSNGQFYIVLGSYSAWQPGHIHNGVIDGTISTSSGGAFSLQIYCGSGAYTVNAISIQQLEASTPLVVNSAPSYTVNVGLTPLNLDTDFTDSNWSGDAGWTLAPTTASSNGSGGYLYSVQSESALSPFIGSASFGECQITYTVSDSSSSASSQLYISWYGNEYVNSADGTYTQQLQCSDGYEFYFWAASGWTGTISNVSVSYMNQVGYTPASLSISNSGSTVLDVRANADDNIFIGLSSGATVIPTSAVDNTALGDNALQADTSGSSNVAVGQNALTNNTTGSYNTALGQNALTNNTTGSYNTALGYSARVTAGLQNATAIGANTIANESDSLILGSNDPLTGVPTLVGIGTSTPQSILQVADPLSNYSALNGGVTTPGLASTWYNSDQNYNSNYAVPDYQVPGNGTLAYSGTDGPIDWPNLLTNAPSGVHQTYINAQWTGWLYADQTGSYKLCTTSDDGSRVYINNFELVNNWYSQGATQRCAQVNLTLGYWYSILVQYFQGGGAASMALQWQEPSGGGIVDIPMANMSSTAPNGTIYYGSIAAPSIVSIQSNQQSDLLALQNSSGTVVSHFDANGNLALGTNTSPGNLLSVGALTTAAGTYQVAVSTGSTTASGIVVQTVAGQSSGYILQAQSSTGSTLASIDYQGNLSVKSATITGTLTINGHIITGGSTPTIGAGAGAGTGPSVSISGNDTSGTITITTGSGPTSGLLATITFGSAYGSAPRVILEPANLSAATLQHYCGSSTSNFTINSANAPAATTTYIYAYHAEQ